MVFSSLLFLFRFLPAILLVYYIVPRRLRNLVLLVFSLGFYAWGEPVYIILMAVSILISYTGGILIDRFRQAEKMQAARIALIVSCALSLSLLVFFKYAGFAVETVNRLTGAGIAMRPIALPIGISFYTFQTLSYTMDVYRKEAAVQKNLISFGAYVTMFPQLIAGPIVQYKTMDAQLRMPCRMVRCTSDTECPVGTCTESAEQLAEGIHRFMIGLGKKVLIANNAGALWDTIQALGYEEVSVLTAWMGLAAYTFQIYFDFSAYSDMAIGLGRMLGFRFLENFNYPYISKSITEFWRRWHISLGTWFREYVYIPLGGNRGSRRRHIRNILIVWLLTGIWHGASWNFLLWGVYYGVLLLAEKFIFGKYLKKVPSLFQHFYCMFLVMLGWHLFVFSDMKQGIGFLKVLFGLSGRGLWNRETVYLLYNHAVLLILCILGSTQIPRNMGKWLSLRLREKEIVLAAVTNVFYIGIFLLSVAWLVDATYNPFLYFRF